MSEILHAPDIDLMEIDACASRLSVILRLLDKATPTGLTGVSTSGVAPIRVKDALPDLPLLNHRAFSIPPVGAMNAKAQWTLGTDEERRNAIATLEASCEPMLGRIVVVERVRSDLSNAPGPGDRDASERIVSSIARLRDLVAGHAAILRRDASSQPDLAERRAMDPVRAAALPFVQACADEMPEADDFSEERFGLRTGNPYPSARLRIESDMYEPVQPLTEATAAALSAALPGTVSLEIRHFAGGVRYLFGPTGIDMDALDPPSDAMQRLRSEMELAKVPRPAWNGRRPG